MQNMQGYSLYRWLFAVAAAVLVAGSSLVCAGEKPDESDWDIGGVIDRIDGNDIVINDSLFHFAAKNNRRAGKFRAGQVVFARLNEKREVTVLVHDKNDGAKSRRGKGKDSSYRKKREHNVSGSIKGAGGTSLHKENGVWKN